MPPEITGLFLSNFYAEHMFQYGFARIRKSISISLSNCLIWSLSAGMLAAVVGGLDIQKDFDESNNGHKAGATGGESGE